MRILIATILSAALLAPSLPAGEWTYFDNNSDIRALYQVGDTLWVGTNGGLLSLDLLSGEITSKRAAGATLPDNSVRALGEHSGKLYVGTDGGVTVITGGGNLTYDGSQSPAFRDVRCISFGVADDTYFGTFGNGVGVMESVTPADNDHHSVEPTTHLYRITREDSLLDNKVFAIAAVDTGRVYFATSLGFCAYRDSAWVSFQAGAGLPRGEVRQLLHDKDDIFYLLIRDRGIYRFDLRRARRVRAPDDFPADEVAAITLDQDGALWAAGRFGRIGRYKKGSWTMFGDSDPDIAGAQWRSAYTGPDNTVFFGSAGGLIAIVRNGELRTVKITSTIPSGFVGPMVESGDGEKFIVNGSWLLSGKGQDTPLSVDMELGSVFALARAPDGAVWLSAPWGLLRHDGDQWQEIRPEINPRAPVFLSLTFDAASRLWAGGHNGEIFRFDGDLWVPYAVYGQLTTEPIIRILVDSGQSVWAVTRSAGVHRYEGPGWRSFDRDTFGGNEIRDAALDAAGRVVVITDNEIWRYEITRGWESSHSPTVRGTDNRVICFDPDNRLYLGTTDGVVIVAPDTTQWLGIQNGLRGTEVTSLLIDSDAVLWVGFRRDGISRIPLAQLER